MNRLFSEINQDKLSGKIEPITSYQKKEEYKEVGIDVIKSGRYAALTMAGGQGTRLGFSGPKGTYFIEYGVNKYIFEVHIERLKNIYNLYGIYIPWFIMTSAENNKDTIKFFEEKNYFNYPKEKINFFIQEELPVLDINGKILMDSKYNIKMAANGHGGVFSALKKSGMLEKMEKDNIEWIFIGGIDNILTPFDNEYFVGFTKAENLMGASYVVPKAYPEERVGVFCKIDDRVDVIEYIEMTSDMSNMRTKDGKLLYGATHTLVNLFSIEAVKIATESDLKYLAALKKINCIDKNGNLITPSKENAYKFETFLFGLFPLLEKAGVLSGVREEIFAPIKNAGGVDSPETAAKLYLDYYKNRG
jgi:UDP-N-acetylglucosamine pyrophosphorylase